MYSYNIGVATQTSAGARAAVYCAVECIYDFGIHMDTLGGWGLIYTTVQKKINFSRVLYIYRLTPKLRMCYIWHKLYKCILQHSKLLRLRLRLFVLLLLCYKNTSMHAQVPTFFFFFLDAADGNDYIAAFQSLAYYRLYTSYLCGTELSIRPGVFSVMLTTC